MKKIIALSSLLALGTLGMACGDAGVANNTATNANKMSNATANAIQNVANTAANQIQNAANTAANAITNAANTAVNAAANKPAVNATANNSNK